MKMKMNKVVGKPILTKSNHGPNGKIIINKNLKDREVKGEF